MTWVSAREAYTPDRTTNVSVGRGKGYGPGTAPLWATFFLAWHGRHTLMQTNDADLADESSGRCASVFLDILMLAVHIFQANSNGDHASSPGQA